MQTLIERGDILNWTIEYIKPLEIVKVVTEGDFNTESHLQMIEDIISQKFWHPGMDTFFDNRKLKFHRTTIPIIKEIGEHHKKYESQIGDGKTALLMKSLADFARGRQLELMIQQHVSTNVSVFMDEQETIQWLTEPKNSNASDFSLT